MIDLPRRNAEGRRDLVARHAGEEAQLDNVRGLGTRGGESIERFAEGEQLVGGARPGEVEAAHVAALPTAAVAQA
jgi:hypothetical protein